MQTNIMYIEKRNNLSRGYTRIGKVKVNDSGNRISYNGRSFHSLKDCSFPGKFYDIETGEEFWISRCRSDDQDRLVNQHSPIFIDENVKEEYWTQIRNEPEYTHRHIANF